jgi:TRAP-type C4-dicarboxylate transport system permease small subunit
MWDESRGTGAYIWLMMLTLPVGFVLVCIGVVMKFVRMRPKLSRGVRKKFPTDNK